MADYVRMKHPVPSDVMMSAMTSSKPVSQRQKGQYSVSRYFCSQITSAWNVSPSHLLRAELCKSYNSV